MIRRFLERSVLALFLVLVSSAALMAETEASLPEIIHLDAVILSADDQTTFDEQLAELEATLSEDLPITRKQAERWDWTEERLAILVAGLLNEAGFEAAVAWGGAEESPRTWVTVALLAGDAAIWVPVDVAWGDGDEDRLGRIPWAEGGEASRFEVAYLAVGGVLDLEPNRQPVAAIRRSLDLYVKKTLLRFYADPSEDVDGELIIYLWSIDGGAPMKTTVPLLMHRFQRAGKYTIALTVMDDRGATDFDEMEIVVLEEEPDCRACDPDA